MAIPKDDRIIFTKAVVDADARKASLAKARAELVKARDRAQKLDVANKNLGESRANLIINYHQELGKINGVFRTHIAESDIQDASDFIVGNHLYPNDVSNPPPSLAPNIWSKTKPYARNKAVGKQYDETYPGAVASEYDHIADVTNKITAITTAYVQMEQSTAQKGEIIPGFCSNPIYGSQSACTTNGGVWTPQIDHVISYPAVSSDLADLVSKVNTLKSHLQSELAVVVTNDYDTSRQAQNNIAISNLNNAIAAIDTWLSYPDFNTSHGQTTMAAFYAYNASLLEPTKLSATQRNALVSALSNRQSVATSRESEINTGLGSINQNLSDGSYTGSGLYYENFQLVGLRLNLIGGSLFEYKNYNRAINAQDDLRANIDNSKAAYSLVLTTSILSAPTNGTKVVHVKSAVGFSVGDAVFIISDNQDELVRVIESINVNAITVSQPVVAKYRPIDAARLYKDIS